MGANASLLQRPSCVRCRMCAMRVDWSDFQNSVVVVLNLREACAVFCVLLPINDDLLNADVELVAVDE